MPSCCFHALSAATSHICHQSIHLLGNLAQFLYPYHLEMVDWRIRIQAGVALLPKCPKGLRFGSDRVIPRQVYLWYAKKKICTINPLCDFTLLSCLMKKIAYRVCIENHLGSQKFIKRVKLNSCSSTQSNTFFMANFMLLNCKYRCFFYVHGYHKFTKLNKMTITLYVWLMHSNHRTTF